MKRRARSLLMMILPAAPLLFPVSAGARQIPRASESAPPRASTNTEESPGYSHVDVPLPDPALVRGGAPLTKEDRRLLAVPRVEKELHADFLRRSGTGLVRLLPRGVYDKKFSLRGGGAYYSFDARTHEYNYGSDIGLEQGEFVVGFAGADFGFMVNIGDAPLENVSAETDGVQFLATYETPSVEPEARAAYRRFAHGEGHREGAWTYRSRLPAVLGNTYALRSVNYGYSDVLVAFRVVRADADGSVVLLWKLLKSYPKPKLERTVAAAARQ